MSATLLVPAGTSVHVRGGERSAAWQVSSVGIAALSENAGDDRCIADSFASALAVTNAASTSPMVERVRMCNTTPTKSKIRSQGQVKSCSGQGRLLDWIERPQRFASLVLPTRTRLRIFATVLLSFTSCETISKAFGSEAARNPSPRT